MLPSRDWFNARLTPLALRLSWAHPNTISVFALVAGLLAGLAYWLGGRHPVFYLLGGALVAVSGVADGLDGVVARVHGRCTVIGDFLDHFFDRLVNVAILAGLALTPHATLSLGLATTIVVLLNSYLGTQIQASFGERHYSGIGKAQLFVALAVVSVLLAVLPDASIPVGAHRCSLVDLFFVVVALSTVHAIGHRCRLAWRLAAEGRGRGGP